MTMENNNAILTENNPDKKQVYQKSEKILLALAFVLAVLCDRLFFDIILNHGEHGNIIFFAAIFEICLLAVFCAFNWEKIYKKPFLWVVAGLILTLCAWNFVFDYAGSYGMLSFVVIPASLMMFCQLVSDAPELKNIKHMIASWFLGWFIKPFVAMHKCVGALSAMLFPKGSAKNAVIKKILAAVIVTVPLLLVLTALLSGADKVFGYYAEKILSAFSFWDFVLHAFLIAAAFLLLYSFFWHTRYEKPVNLEIRESSFKIDNVVSHIILGSVLVLYALFCAVQFAYLFASAGLPPGVSYSDYARKGFAQIVVVSGINLVIFGIMVKYGEKSIALKIMLYAFLAVTGIMLASGFVRLGLYINTFGMTFLRLISAWFIIYLALVLILCYARLLIPKLPLVAVSAVLLLACYNVLGYINPDAFIVRYNLAQYSEYTADDWVEENQSYVFYDLSDDALNALIEKGLNKDRYSDFLGERHSEASAKKSYASAKLKSALNSPNQQYY
ncbi:MAG: DUF4173 domain-containing protein [Oscillospiraceae bacterium]|nr:DUF4173 domain-containing protein [Oscillospiraceae bacterium]